jgi:hypothetical protein
MVAGRRFASRDRRYQLIGIIINAHALSVAPLMRADVPLFRYDFMWSGRKRAAIGV